MKTLADLGDLADMCPTMDISQPWANVLNNCRPFSYYFLDEQRITLLNPLVGWVGKKSVSLTDYIAKSQWLAKFWRFAAQNISRVSRLNFLSIFCRLFIFAGSVLPYK